MPPKSKTKTKRKTLQSWEETAKEAQEYRNASIARVDPSILNIPQQPTPGNSKNANVAGLIDNYLSDDEIAITGLPTDELVRQLASGVRDAVTVARAFLRKAGVAQRLTNCITELLPEQALERAEHLDRHLRRHGTPVGPLHGLPISIKEHIGIKGLGLNGGYVSKWANRAGDDALVLKILKRAGAVPFARTTQPQSLMHLETDSNLYGRTLNPYNTELSAGGSSGGEGALIGLGASCLGIGTDIGGSIRSPAANNGIYGLKPTAFRVPTGGWSSTPPGADPIVTVIGPLSADLNGIKLFMKVVLDAKPWIREPDLIPLPWDMARYSPWPDSRPLKIAVMWHDGVVRPHPPIQRALRQIRERLLSSAARTNVEVVEWRPHQHDEAWAIVSSLYFTDGGAEDAAAMAESGEPWRPLTEWIIRENPCVRKLDMRKYAYWQEEREEYRREYAEVWNRTATNTTTISGGRGANGDGDSNDDNGDGSKELRGMVDAILCPVGPGVAPRHDTAKYWGYTAQWNLLDYPALVFPVTKVDREIDVPDPDFAPMTDVDAENWKLYSANDFHGVPVSLQLVGRRFEDEKIMAVLEYLQRIVELPFAEFKS